MNIGCVVKASGISKRFGDNKLLAPLFGKPLLSHTLSSLPENLARTVVVARHPQVAALAQGMGLEVILHTLPQVSDTIRLGLSALQDMDGCLFCVGDQPACSKATITRLVEAFQADPQYIYRLRYQGQPGAPVLFPNAYFSELLSLTGEETGSLVMRRHPQALRFVDAASAFELMDVDTPEHLEALKKFLQPIKNDM